MVLRLRFATLRTNVEGPQLPFILSGAKSKDTMLYDEMAVISLVITEIR